jgi:hypothetical protein
MARRSRRMIPAVKVRVFAGQRQRGTVKQHEEAPGEMKLVW